MLQFFSIMFSQFECFSLFWYYIMLCYVCYVRPTLFLMDSLMLIKGVFIWSEYRKNCNIVKYYCNFKYCFPVLIYFKIQFIPVKQSWFFSIITPVFSVIWSSEIILICWFIVSVETVVLLNCFWKVILFYLMNSKLKRTAFIQNKKLF